MTEAKALIVTYAVSMTLFTAVGVGLDLIGAKDEVFVAVGLFIAAGGAFAVSAVVMHYAEREKRARRESHNAPPSG